MEIPRQILAHRRYNETTAETILRLYYDGGSQPPCTAAKRIIQAIREELSLDDAPYHRVLNDWLEGTLPAAPEGAPAAYHEMAAEVRSYSIDPDAQHAPLEDGELPMSQKGRYSDPTYSQHVPQAIRAEQYPEELLSHTIIRLGKANATPIEQEARKLCLRIREDLSLSVPMGPSHVATWLLGEWRKEENHQAHLI